MSSIRKSWVQALTSVLLSALLAVSTTASVSPKPLLPTNGCPNGLVLKAGPIASSMNGRTFLQELVALKAATNTEYKTSRPQQQQQQQRKQEDNNNNDGKPFRIPDFRSMPLDAATTCSTVASCEYSGNLWFLPRGLKFRETVLVKGISDDEKSATVECNSEYHNGKRWVQCVQTTCEIQTAHNHNESGNTVQQQQQQLRMAVRSNVKVRLPIPGINGQVERMINSTFQNALVAFVLNYHGIESNSFLLV